MKILIVLVRLKGGVGRANTEIAKALRKKGHTVDILSREDDLKKNSFKESFLPLRKKVRKLLKKEAYDIIYVQDYSCLVPIIFPYPLTWKKLFYASIGVKWKPGIQKATQDILGKIMGKKTIVLFHHNKKRFPKSHVVYRGVNTDMFKPLRKKRMYLGYMNKFSELVEAQRYETIAKKLGLKTIHSGEQKKKEVKRTFEKESKHSFDKIPDEKMNEFYNKCHVFVNLATPDAGFNLSWLEAMAAGVPVVIGNDNGAGPILPFDKILDEKDMEKQIVKIVKNPKKIDYRKWIINNGFTWDKVADKLLDVFQGKTK